jgi:hypothetical protein
MRADTQAGTMKEPALKKRMQERTDKGSWSEGHNGENQRCRKRRAERKERTDTCSGEQTLQEHLERTSAVAAHTEN